MIKLRYLRKMRNHYRNNFLLFVIALLVLSPFALGEVVVNEIMSNPSDVNDNVGEYLELFNTGNADVDLQGWELRDNGGEVHQIGQELVVVANGFTLLCINSDANVNGDLACNYQFENFVLGNGDDEVVLIDQGGVEHDRVEYGEGRGFLNQEGVSLELIDAASDNNLAASWRLAQTSLDRGDDLGTPGVANNGAPTLSIDNQSVEEDAAEPLEVDLANFASDSEQQAQDLVFTVESQSNLEVVGCFVLPNGHTLRCTPRENQEGSSDIEISVEDSGELKVRGTFRVTVTPVNDAPTLVIANQDVLEDSGLLEINLAELATDVDNADDELVFTLDSESNEDTINCELNEQTLECNTVADQNGNSTVEVSVRDPAGLEGDVSFTISVAAVNDAPTLVIANQDVLEDTGDVSYDLFGFANDVDNADDELTFTLDSQSDESAISCALNADGHTLDCTTVQDQFGENVVGVTTRDQAGLEAVASFTITVSDVNEVPVIEEIDTVSVIEGMETTYQVVARDDDDNALHYDLEGVGNFESVTIDENGLIKIVAHPMQELEQGITVVVTDFDDEGNAIGGRAEEAFTIEVTSVLDIVGLRVGLEGGALQVYENEDTTARFGPGDTITFEVDVLNRFTEESHNIIEQEVEPFIEEISLRVSGLGILPIVVDDDGNDNPLFLGAQQTRTITFTYEVSRFDILGDREVTFSLSGKDLDVPAHSYSSQKELVVPIKRDAHDVVIKNVGLFLGDVEVENNELTCEQKQDGNLELHYDLENLGLDQDESVTVEIQNVDLFEEPIREVTPMLENVQSVVVTLNLAELVGEKTFRVRAIRTSLPDLVYDTKTIEISAENCAPTFSADFIAQLPLLVNEDAVDPLVVNLSEVAANVEENQVLEFSVDNVNEERFSVQLANDEMIIRPVADYFTPAGEVERFDFIVSDGSLSNELEVTLRVVRQLDDEISLGEVVPAQREAFINVNAGNNDEQEFSIAIDNFDQIPFEVAWFVRDINDGEEINQNNNALNFRFRPNVGGNFEVKVVLSYVVEGENREIERIWQVQVVDRPVGFANFGGSDTTDIDNVVDVSDASLVLENGFGKVEWLNRVDLRPVVDISEVVLVRDSFVGVDSANARTLDTRAKVTLKKVFNNPVILRSAGFNAGEFAVCGDRCTVDNNPEAGTFSFTVDGFSSFRVEERVAAGIGLVSEIVFADAVRGEEAIVDVTIRNSGSVDALTGLQVEFEGDALAQVYGAQVIGNIPGQLPAGESFTFQLKIMVPEQEDTVSHQIGVLKVVSDQEEKTANILLDARGVLVIEQIEVNGRSNGDFDLDEVNDIEIDVRNEGVLDLEDVEVEVTIRDIDGGDDEDETSDEKDIDAGDKESFSVEFDLAKFDIEDDSFEVEVVVEGRDENRVVHTVREVITVNLDLKSHEVVLDRVSLSPSTLECSYQTQLDVTVLNRGEKDEDEVEIHVFNSELGIDLREDEIEVDKFTDSDNDERETFRLSLPQDLVAKGYPITVELYLDGDLEETQVVALDVRECGAISGSSYSAPQQPQFGSANDFARQLQEQLNRQAQLRGGVAPVVQQHAAVGSSTIRASFRESNTYVLVLGTLIVLAVIAMMLAMAVLLARKPRKVNRRQR
jgi:hypothetical protein